MQSLECLYSWECHQKGKKSISSTPKALLFGRDVAVNVVENLLDLPLAPNQQEDLKVQEEIAHLRVKLFDFEESKTAMEDDLDFM